MVWLFKSKANLIFLITFLGFFMIQEAKALTFDQNNGLKISNFLEEVSRISQKTGKPQGKVAEFSQDDFNAFFQNFLVGQIPAVKSVELKLLPENKLEGHLVLNLKDFQLPQYFKEEINIYFGATIVSRDRKVQLLFKDLYLETQKIEPQVLDFLIDSIAKTQNLEPHHLSDWYDLPGGVEKISTVQGKIRIYY